MHQQEVLGDQYIVSQSWEKYDENEGDFYGNII
jgi:hypothetical protein